MKLLFKKLAPWIAGLSLILVSLAVGDHKTSDKTLSSGFVVYTYRPYHTYYYYGYGAPYYYYSSPYYYYGDRNYYGPSYGYGYGYYDSYPGYYHRGWGGGWGGGHWHRW